MQIATNTVASFDYTLTDDEGRVLDTSDGREPVSYLHGAGSLLPKLETALEGQSAGESVAVTVPAADAYGERDERLVQDVPLSLFKGIETVEKGMRFQVSTPEGQQQDVTVIGVDADTATVDANHPLAGKALNFELRIVEVRDATDAELKNGKVASAK